MSFPEGFSEIAPMLAYTPGALIFIGGIVLAFILAIYAAYYVFFRKDE